MNSKKFGKRAPAFAKKTSTKPYKKYKSNASHKVVLCQNAAETSGQKGRKLYAFSWEDVGALLNVSVKEAQILARPLYVYEYAKEDVGNMGKRRKIGKRKVREALFDPTDLRSLAKYANKPLPGIQEQIQAATHLLREMVSSTGRFEAAWERAAEAFGVPLGDAITQFNRRLKSHTDFSGAQLEAFAKLPPEDHAVPSNDAADANSLPRQSFICQTKALEDLLAGKKPTETEKVKAAAPRSHLKEATEAMKKVTNLRERQEKVRMRKAKDAVSAGGLPEVGEWPSADQDSMLKPAPGNKFSNRCLKCEGMWLNGQGSHSSTCKVGKTS